MKVKVKRTAIFLAMLVATGAWGSAQESLHISHKYQNVDAQSLIGLPMGDHKTIVDRQGNLHWSQWSLARKGLDVTFGFSNQLDGELGIALSTSSQEGKQVSLKATHQDLDEGRYPFVVTSLEGGAFTAKEIAFATTIGNHGLDVVQITATNNGDKDSSVDLRLSGKQRNLPAFSDGALLATHDDVLLASLEPAAAVQKNRDPYLLLARQMVPAHGTATFLIRVPYGLQVNQRQAVESFNGAELLVKARRLWDDFWSRGMKLDLPKREQELVDFYLSSVAYVFILTERDAKGELWALDGPALYREFWGRGEYFQGRAMAVAGYPEIDRESVQHTFSLQKDDGEWDWPVTSGWPAWDNIGGNAGAVWDSYLFTRDKKWLAEAYPYVKRAAEWINLHREETEIPSDAPTATQPIRRQIPNKCMDEPEPTLKPGEKPYWWGLLPWSYGDSGLPPGHPFPHNMWALYTMKVAQNAALELGKQEDAERYGRLYGDYKRAILTSMTRAIGLEKEDAPYLPAMPTYPNAGVSQSFVAVYPTELLKADNLWVSNLLKRMQRTELQGLPTYMAWLGPSGVWPGESMNVAETYLRRGDVSKTVSLLTAALEHSYETKVWKEEIKVDKRLPVACLIGNSKNVEDQHGTGDMPEAWANANLVALVRDMLLREEVDNLFLLSGIPAEWIQPGEHISIASAPTTLGGDISYRLDYVAQDQMKLHLKFAGRTTVLQIRFPLAAGKTLHTVIVNGQPVQSFKGNTLTLKDYSGTAEIQATF